MEKRKIYDCGNSSSSRSNSKKIAKDLSLQRCSHKSEIADSNRPLLQRCSSSKNKKLYLSFRDGRNGTLYWCQIDPPNTISEDISIFNTYPLFTFPASVVGFTCATAALGSKLYMIGGLKSLEMISQGSKDVLFFDTAAGMQKQKDQMLVSRRNPFAVSTEGKIYVFGDGDNPIWGEVFDPHTNSWSPIAEPPLEARKQGFQFGISSAVIGDKILLFQHTDLFSFDVKTNHWEILTSTHPLLYKGMASNGVTLAHNFILTYTEAAVQAYDFSAKIWLKVKGLGIKRFSMMYWENLLDGYVVCLNPNQFCLVYIDQDESVYSKTYYVRCVVFRLSTVTNSKGEIQHFRAEVLGRSAHSLPFAFNWSHFQNCFSL